VLCIQANMELLRPMLFIAQSMECLEGRIPEQ
jgi:hypothetical protein